MSQRVTKCTVYGQAGHTRIHCLVMCGSCSGDSRKCACEQPPVNKDEVLADVSTDCWPTHWPTVGRRIGRLSDDTLADEVRTGF